MIMIIVIIKMMIHKDIRYNYFHKNSNRGLSAGGIVAIVVCCVVTLAAVIAIGMATKNAAASSSADRANLNNSEIRKI